MKQMHYYKLKACLKRYVFTWHLKFDRESRLHISLGRLFQSFGATKQNALATTKCWEYLTAWNLKHNFFAGSHED